MGSLSISRRNLLRCAGLIAGSSVVGALWPLQRGFTSNLGNAIPGPVAHDLSGLITVQLFYYRSFRPREHFMEYSVDVAGDMVAVGGGVIGIEDPGALIFSSHPNDDMSAWMIGTKDHETPAPHYITGYAIGMKIEGMTKAELVESIMVLRNVTEPMPHPQATVALPEGYALLGGGLRVEWDGAGNLATGTYPIGDHAWAACSKDHDISDPGTLTVYAIGLKKNLPAGTVSTTIAKNKSGIAPHPLCAAKLPPGYALSGGGALVDYHGDGNLLWRLQPVIDGPDQGYVAASKDHNAPDPAAIITYATGVRLTPA